VTSSEIDAGPADSAPKRAAPARSRWLVLLAFVVAIALTAAVVSRCSSDGSATGPPSSTLDVPTQTAIDAAVEKALAAQGLSVADVYQKIQPSVVEIDVEQDATAPTSPAGDDGQGLGTGVIVNQNGSILTANHVVEHATTIRVVYADGTRSAATVASADAQQDIALLTPETLPSIVVPAVLGSSDGVGVGAPVVAVGNPLGLDDTTTSGVVSALDRSIRADGGSRRTGLIQFDAAVNPGSSGGPLLNTRGETIGIVVALADPSDDGYFIGIGFAVPIGTALAAGGGSQPPK
jgi:putative serine protease PepD